MANKRPPMSKQRKAGILLYMGDSRKKVMEQLGLSLKQVELAERNETLRALRSVTRRVWALEQYVGPDEVKRLRKERLGGK